MPRLLSRLLPETTTARTRPEVTDHTDWCARDHRCNLGEHRGEAMPVTMPGVGRVLITRVASGGREYVEIHGRARLHDTSTGSRWQLGVLLNGMELILSRIALPSGTVPARNPRGSKSLRHAALPRRSG